ncbi:MAG TPA: ornithine cyclodeaminase family protein [Actinomycetota bacterium]|nr:ornithine cyclodeaminase family protein [Actinomycetota bacterium]
MSDPEYFDGERLRKALSMEEAIGALEEVFSGPLPLTPQRSVLERDGDQLLLMPSWDARAAGVKLVTVNEKNPSHGLPLIQGVYVLFAGDTLKPIALFDAAELTALRTAAVSALATKYLARPDARHLVVFGAGIQGEAHIEAMSVVRNIDRVTIVSRSEEGALRLAASPSVAAVDSSVGGPDSVRHADIVCTCTTSTTPVFDGSLLPAGCHVNAVGSHRPAEREIDSTAITRATVFVETRQAALAEAGDLLIPMKEGALKEVAAGDLSEVVGGRIGRSSKSEITLLKSVGVAFEDLAVALAAAKVLVEGLRPQ